MQLSYIMYYIGVLVCMCLSIESHIKGEKLSCDVGYDYITEKVPVKFSITEKPVYFGCLSEDLEIGESVWPGAPKNLNVSMSSRHEFMLAWKPPYDSSVQHVTGFLLRLFIEDYSYIHSMDPDVCYLVNFSKNQLLKSSQDEAVIQDAILRVKCHVTSYIDMSVRVFITTVPLPSPPRPFQEVTTVIHINGIKTEHTPRPTTDIQENTIEILDRPERNITETVIISISVVVLSVVMIIVIIYGGYRCLRLHISQQNRHSRNNEDIISSDIVKNNELLNVGRKTIGEEHSKTILDKDFLEEDDFKCNNEASPTTDEWLPCQHTNQSLPHKYGNMFLKINMES